MYILTDTRSATQTLRTSIDFETRPTLFLQKIRFVDSRVLLGHACVSEKISLTSILCVGVDKVTNRVKRKSDFCERCQLASLITSTQATKEVTALKGVGNSRNCGFRVTWTTSGKLSPSTNLAVFERTTYGYAPHVQLITRRAKPLEKIAIFDQKIDRQK